MSLNLTSVAPFINQIDMHSVLQQIQQVVRVLRVSGSVTVLTGAGCSTESGIPDYRSPGRVRANPINIQLFLNDQASRNRYWARSFVAYPKFIQARPNQAHHSITRLFEECQTVRGEGIVTQNVDSLHGIHDHVVELHGHLRTVRCLKCKSVESRLDYQKRLYADNLELISEMGLTDLIRAFSEKSSERPDGDIEIKHEQADRFYNEFRVSVCLDCQKGQMRPDVVFFGENIEQSIAEKSYQLVDNAGSLLIVGTSLATWSSYRLAVRAKERNLPICIINHGPTRADQISSIKIDGLAGMILPRLVEEISR